MPGVQRNEPGKAAVGARHGRRERIEPDRRGLVRDAGTDVRRAGRPLRLRLTIPRARARSVERCADADALRRQRVRRIRPNAAFLLGRVVPDADSCAFLTSSRPNAPGVLCEAGCRSNVWRLLSIFFESDFIPVLLVS
jgi:hypothetical protein